MNTTMISVKGLTKKIGNKQILDGLDFDIMEGRVVGLLGPNSAGKTSLIKILMNLYYADSGEVLILGRPASFETRQFISYMPDVNHLFPWMRVTDAIQYYNDMFDDFDMERCNNLCSSLDINPKDKVSSLSKGTKERVLIMLTFSRNARLYLLDEPIGGIDLLTRNKIIKTIFGNLTGNRTIIISTHQVSDVETLLDDVLFLNKGKLIYSDNVDNIRENKGMSIEECYMEVFQNA